MSDLFDPAFKGKIGMLTEMRDTVGLTMLAHRQGPGRPPPSTTPTEAFDMIEEASGRRADPRSSPATTTWTTSRPGTSPPASGWSGDIAQLALDNPDLRFVIPEEGGMQWSRHDGDPRTGRRTSPTRRSGWTTSTTRATPPASPPTSGTTRRSQGVQEVLAAGDDTEKALAESPLLFPDEATLAKLHVFANLDEETEAAFDERFAEITGA